MRWALPLLLIVIACASQRAAPSDEPAWSVLYDGQKRGRGEGNECRMGRDGKQVCGFHCRTGSDGVVKCARTEQGSCTIGADGRAACKDPLFADELDGGV